MTVAYRVGVRDREPANATLYYDQASLEAAEGALALLQQYARDGVTMWIEERAPNGWRTAASDH
jgi:hypothetical protein